MILCDLCGQAKECTPRQIEGNEYDICADCWNPLAEKLKGKGRGKKQREMVFLPPLKTEPEPPPQKPGPLEPPKIWGEAGRLQYGVGSFSPPSRWNGLKGMLFRQGSGLE